MREALFIKKNADKWQSYQQEEPTNPDEASVRFVTLMDDLAYARTFYPKSKVTKWINGLAATTYQNIYKNKKEKYSRILNFWKYDLPITFRKHHNTFLFTTLLFVIIVAIGVFSAIYNPEFTRGILGDHYVDMTEQNIANGDPFGVYKEENRFLMFVQIGFNNIRVSFLAFIGGLLLGFGTLYIMWSNGLMLGCFQHMFFAQGLGVKSVLVIWIHGTIEIAAIVLASTAGFVIAKGMFFPKTYSRINSFKMHFKDAAKLIICLVPFFILAAFFEGFITQEMSSGFDKNGGGMPVWVSVLILASSLFLIVWYFVIWPIKLEKKGITWQKKSIALELLQQHA
jgi:uncharacterized membrane protein SpoIIM required for sporulation